MFSAYGQTQDGRQPRRAARAASQNAKTLRIAGNFIEKQRRRLVFFHIELADRTQLEIPIRAPHFPQLAEPLNLAQPHPQIERIPGFGLCPEGFVLHRISLLKPSIRSSVYSNKRPSTAGGVSAKESHHCLWFACNSCAGCTLRRPIFYRRKPLSPTDRGEAAGPAWSRGFPWPDETQFDSPG